MCYWLDITPALSILLMLQHNEVFEHAENHGKPTSMRSTVLWQRARKKLVSSRSDPQAFHSRLQVVWLAGITN